MFRSGLSFLVESYLNVCPLFSFFFLQGSLIILKVSPVASNPTTLSPMCVPYYTLLKNTCFTTLAKISERYYKSIRVVKQFSHSNPWSFYKREYERCSFKIFFSLETMKWKLKEVKHK